MRLLPTAAILLCLAASPAFAASTGACKDKGEAAAHALTELPQGDAAFNRAVSAATQPAEAAKVRAESHCRRNASLSGEDADAFPRVFVDQKQKTDMAFLLPAMAHGKKVYVLIKTWGSGAVRVDGLFDAIPTDDRLMKAMTNFTDGGYDPIGVDAQGKLLDSNNIIPVLLAATAKRMG